MFRVLSGGVCECDTAEEAAELAERLANGRQDPVDLSWPVEGDHGAGTNGSTKRATTRRVSAAGKSAQGKNTKRIWGLVRKDIANRPLAEGENMKDRRSAMAKANAFDRKRK